MILYVPHHLLTPYLGREYYFHHKYDMFRDNLSYILEGLIPSFDKVFYIEPDDCSISICVTKNNCGMKYALMRVELEHDLDVDFIIKDIIRKAKECPKNN